MRVRASLLILLCGCGAKVDLAPQRTACTFGRGDLPGASLADFDTLGERIPIDHFIIVMQENRSFDHYFSSLTVPGQTIDGASPLATNPNPEDGGVVTRFHQ